MGTLMKAWGKRTLNQLGYVGGFTIQLWAGLRAIGTSLPILGNRYRWKASVNQMLQIGSFSSANDCTHGSLQRIHSRFARSLRIAPLWSPALRD